MYYIPRENNTRADLLSKLASTKKDRALQGYHPRDAPNSHHRHWGSYGWRRRGTRLDDPLQEFPNSGGVTIRREWSLTPVTEGYLLCHPWWQAIQKKVDNTFVKMPKQPIRKLFYDKTSQRDLLPLYRGMLPCNQSGACRLLLVDTQGRRPRLHNEVKTMLGIRWRFLHPSWQSQ